MFGHCLKYHWMHDFDKLGIATTLHCQVALFDTYHCFSHPKSKSRKGPPFRRMSLQPAEQSLIPPPSAAQAVPKHNNIPDSCWAGNSLYLRENSRLRFQVRQPSKARGWVETAWLKCPGLGSGALTTHGTGPVPAVAEASCIGGFSLPDALSQDLPLVRGTTSWASCGFGQTSHSFS